MPRHLPKVINREDIPKLFSAINTKCPTGLRNRVALQLMYRCGLRVSEVCNLTLDDVSLEEGYLYIRDGKGKKDRTVPIDPETAEWCRKWLAVRPEGGVYFLRNVQRRKHEKVSDRYLRELCHRLSQRTGVYLPGRKPVHPHTFRACAATERLEDGWSIVEVQELLGHSSITTTRIYTQVRPHILKQKMQALPPIAAAKEGL